MWNPKSIQRKRKSPAIPVPSWLQGPPPAQASDTHTSLRENFCFLEPEGSETTVASPPEGKGMGHREHRWDLILIIVSGEGMRDLGKKVDQAAAMGFQNLPITCGTENPTGFFRLL